MSKRYCQNRIAKLRWATSFPMRPEIRYPQPCNCYVFTGVTSFHRYHVDHSISKILRSLSVWYWFPFFVATIFNTSRQIQSMSLCSCWNLMNKLHILCFHLFNRPFFNRLTDEFEYGVKWAGGLNQNNRYILLSIDYPFKWLVGHKNTDNQRVVMENKKA